MRLFALALVAVPLAASLRAQEQTIVLDPAGPWQLDGNEQRCRLGREFGGPQNKILFYMEQWAPGYGVDWAVAGHAIEHFSSFRKAHFSFGPGGYGADFNFLDASIEPFGKSVATRSALFNDDEARFEQQNSDTPPAIVGLPEIDSNQAGHVDSLTLAQHGRDSVKLKLGNMKSPVLLFNQCINSLVKSWGLDPVAIRDITNGPEITNIRGLTWQIQQTYPSKALEEGAQADFLFRAVIDKNGKIVRCEVLNKTMAKGFGNSQGACAIFERYAKIKPASDKNGNPVASFYTTVIKYRVR